MKYSNFSEAIAFIRAFGWNFECDSIANRCNKHLNEDVWNKRCSNGLKTDILIGDRIHSAMS